MADNPRAAFRTISGLIIALFVASATVGVITTILSYGGTANEDSSAHETLIATIVTPDIIGLDGQRAPSATVAVPPAVSDTLQAIPGVLGASVVYSQPGERAHSSLGLVACSQLSRTPAIGACAAGTQVANLTGLDPFGSGDEPSLTPDMCGLPPT